MLLQVEHKSGNSYFLEGGLLGGGRQGQQRGRDMYYNEGERDEGHEEDKDRDKRYGEGGEGMDENDKENDDENVLYRIPPP